MQETKVPKTPKIDRSTLETIRKQQKQYLTKRLKSKAFSKDLLSHLKLAQNDLLNKKVNDIIKEETVQRISRIVLDEQVLNNLIYPSIEKSIDYTIDYLKNNPTKVADIIPEEVQTWIENIIRMEFNPSKEQVKKIMDHKAMRELLVTIIQDGINAFERSINPMAGVMKSFINIDKEVRKFLHTFIDHSIDKTVDYMISNQNKKMFREFGITLFHLILEESISNLVSKLPETLWENIKGGINSELKSFTKTQMYESIEGEMIQYFFEEYGEKTLQEIVDQYKVPEDILEIALEILHTQMMEYFSSEVGKDFILKEIDLFFDNLALE